MERILVVEDNPTIARELTMSLELNGFEVKHAPDLSTARKRVVDFKPALIVLDVNLPDGLGFDFSEELRRENLPTSILFLTARQDEDSVVQGFASGGCDFLRKPYKVQELIVRVRHLLGRPVARFQQFKFAQLTLDLVGKKALYGEKPLDLSDREFDILALLAKGKGEIVTRDSMMATLDSEGEILDRSLDSHVSRLRGKLKKASDDKLKIKTEYGLGYKLEE